MPRNPSRQLSRIVSLLEQVHELSAGGGNQKATALAKEALHLALQLLPAEPEAIMCILRASLALGELYRVTGDYSKAKLYLEEARDLIRRDAGDDFPLLAFPLRALGDLYFTLGDIQMAETHYQQARTLVENDPNRPPNIEDLYASILDGLAQIRIDLAEFDSAKALAKLALDIRTDLFENIQMPYMALTLACSLNTIASIHHSVGDLAEAKRSLQRALSLLKDTVGENHESYGQILHNLGELYRSLHDYERAKAHLQEALRIRKKTLRIDHPLTATTIANIAGIYIETGDTGNAYELLQETAEVVRKTAGEDSPGYATSLTNLAGQDESSGNLAHAKSMHERALEIRRRVFGNDNPAVANSLGHLGGIYARLGDTLTAERYHAEALQIQQASFGQDHEHVAHVLLDLAVLYTATGRYAEALTKLQAAAPILDRMISEVFSVSSEARRVGYLASIRRHLNIALSLVSQHMLDDASAVQFAMEMVLRRKALGFEAASMERDAILSAHNPELKNQLRQLSMLRMQIAQKWLAGPGPEGLQYHRDQLAEWEDQRDSLEEQLAGQLPQLRLDQWLRNAGLQDVALALPARSVLLEFVRYRLFDFQAEVSEAKPSTSARYLVFVVPAGDPSRARMVDLGNAGEMDGWIADFRSSITGRTEARADTPSRDAELLGDFPEETPSWSDQCPLIAAILGRLAPLLGNCDHLMLSPDGDFNRLPFEVVPTSENRRLIDDYRISYVAVGRDVVRFGSAAKQAQKPLIIADPNFDLEEPEQSSITGGRQPPDTEWRDVRFPRLPGTQVEAVRLAAMLGVVAMVGDNALEKWVKCVRSPLVLHLATHGFFKPDREPDLAGQRGWKPPSEMGSGPSGAVPRSRESNPMLQSGLVLAGANTYCRGEALPEDAEDGLLTAEDVRGLDLTGTELVVASACGTGLGEVRAGEGVFGLRRAFALAGAKTLIMSLWPVSDIATAILMDRFYEALLRRALGRHEALREAQLYLRNLSIADIRREWLSEDMISRFSCENPQTANFLLGLSRSADSDCPFRDPRYWGAFICQGDIGPLPTVAIERLRGETKK